MVNFDSKTHKIVPDIFSTFRVDEFGNRKRMSQHGTNGKKIFLKNPILQKPTRNKRLLSNEEEFL